MKTCLATLLAGLLCQAASAQCLPAAGAVAEAASEPGSGLWLTALALMAGIAWRRQGA